MESIRKFYDGGQTCFQRREYQKARELFSSTRDTEQWSRAAESEIDGSVDFNRFLPRIPL